MQRNVVPQSQNAQSALSWICRFCRFAVESKSNVVAGHNVWAAGMCWRRGQGCVWTVGGRNAKQLKMSYEICSAC